MSTRRANTPLGELRWDHGAQYFTARDEGFIDVIAALENEGAVAKWSGPFAEPVTEPRFVGAPGMNGVIRALASNHTVDWGRRVSKITGASGAYRLVFEDGTVEGPFEAVLSAVPAEQVAPLLAPVASTLAKEAESVQSAPSWAVMLAFDTPIDMPSQTTAGAGSIGWISKNSSKPHRDSAETWLVHATAEWSKAHLEDEREDVLSALVPEFLNLVGAVGLTPVYAAAHRWRYAFVETPTGKGASWDPELKLGTCGDWHLGPRVECAWLSGRRLAEKVLGA